MPALTSFYAIWDSSLWDDAAHIWGGSSLVVDPLWKGLTDWLLLNPTKLAITITEIF
jgi:hypothetical protein